MDATAVPRLILASTSPYRRQLLERLGLAFQCESPGVDESSCLESDPAKRALGLAVAKARAVAARHPDAIVIGGDQVLDLDGHSLGKPGTAEAARVQLGRLSGRAHSLITAIALVAGERVWTHIDLTRLTLRDLSDDEIARYVDHDQPLDCAGSYKFESLGIGLFDQIESKDPTAIVGLPLMALCRGLGLFGIRVV